MKLTKVSAPLVALLMTTLMIAACDSNASLRSGAYVIDRVETIEAIQFLGIEDSIQADLLKSHEHSWLILDMDTRKVHHYALSSEEPASGELSESLNELHTDRGEILPFEQLGRNRFALTMSLLGEYRMVYRWVDDDSNELAKIRAEREALIQREAERISRRKAQLRSLMDETVELDLRLNLPTGEVSIALPADASSPYESDTFGYSLLWPGIWLDKVNILALPSSSRGDDMAAYFEQEHQRFQQSIPANIALDDDTLIGVDSDGRYRLLARAEQGEYTAIMKAEVSEQQFPMLISIWNSLDSPVEEVELLRRPEVVLPQNLIGQDAFNQFIADTLAQETFPNTFLRSRLMHRGSGVFGFGSISLLEDQEADQESTLSSIDAELFEGTPKSVIKEFTSHSIYEHTGIYFSNSYNSLCRAYAAIEVDLGVADRPYTLLFFQEDLSNYANCLVTLAAFENYDLTQQILAEVPPALLDHFAAYPFTWPTDRGDVIVTVDGLEGLISSTGQILAPAEYDDIDTRSNDAGYTLTRDRKKGFITTNGELILPFLYDQIHPFADDRALLVLQGNLQGLYNLQTGRFTLPLSKQLTRINYSGDGLFITQGNNGADLYNIQGDTLIEGADIIMNIRTQPMFAVRKEGSFRFHGLEGQLLSDAEYSSVSPNYSAERISVRDTDGRSFYIDFDLNRLTPEGLIAVYPPTEGGYTVVADKSMQPIRFGMTGPDDELLLPLEFFHVFTVREGLITAQAQNSLWGIWDKTGEQVLAPEWQTMGQSYDGKIYARRDDLWQLINQQGAPLDDRRWSTLLFTFRNMYNHPPFVAARITPDQPDNQPRWEILDMFGERLIDETFDTVTQFDFGVQVTRGNEQLKYPDDFR